jgi:hypothetical protein
MLDHGMPGKRIVAVAMTLMVTLLCSLIASPLPAQDEELPLNFDAVAVNMSNVGPRGQMRLQIRVDRWSTDEERTKLMEALRAQTGQSRDRTLANALFDKESVGTIRESRTLAYDFGYSREIPSDAGRMIVLATDRRIAFAESWRSARTLDYNVSLIVLNLDEEGRGDGQLMVGATFEWDEANNQITITNFASEPIRLTRVRTR